MSQPERVNGVTPALVRHSRRDEHRLAVGREQPDICGFIANSWLRSCMIEEPSP